MSKRGLGSLADLAKILEEASNPESAVREDRKESKPKMLTRKAGSLLGVRRIDPKRKAWYQKRLREQTEKLDPARAEAPLPELAVKPAMTKAVATRVGVGLLETLAGAKDVKDLKAKADGKGKQKAEAWRRKPGDPIF